MPTEGPLVASQLGATLDRALAAHPSPPRFLPPPTHHPWQVSNEADFLFAHPETGWAQAPAERPATWPGRLRSIQTATAGIDGFPGWLTQGVDMSCARGVFSEQIADYVMAAIYAFAKPFETMAPQGPGDWNPKTLAPLRARPRGSSAWDRSVPRSRAAQSAMT